MAKSPASAVDPRSDENIGLLLELAEAASGSLDLDQLLERIAGVIRRAIQYETFAILLVDDATQELYVRYAAGHDQEYVRSLRLKPGEGITGAAVAAGRPILVQDVAADPRYVQGAEGVRSELAVPLIARNRVIGVLDVQSRETDYFSQRHSDLLSLAATRVALAVQNARLYRSTLRQAEILSRLAEISREFSSILQLNDLLRKIAEQVRSLIAYDAFSLLLLDERAAVLKGYLSLRATEVMKEKLRVPMGEGIVGHVAVTRRSMLVPNVRKESRYIPLNEATRSEMTVPLIAKERVIGVLDLESTRRGFFTQRHLQMMEMLAPQVAIAIENARLYEQLAREEARMERDLTAARELQSSLLPHCCPKVPGVQISARFEPAREVGGDLYDFFEFRGADGELDGLGVFTGDVSGKGAPAAIYAALGFGLIRTVSSARLGTGETLSHINRLLCERRIEARYLALTYAYLDVRNWTLDLANGGLPNPILCRNGEILPMRIEGVPLGLLDNVDYAPTRFELRPGDTAVFYSDGITENFSPQHEEYGRKRLRQLVQAHCGEGAGRLVARIFEEAERWSGGRPPSDDRTVVVVRIGEDGACPSKP